MASIDLGDYELEDDGAGNLLLRDKSTGNEVKIDKGEIDASGIKDGTIDESKLTTTPTFDNPYKNMFLGDVRFGSSHQFAEGAAVPGTTLTALSHLPVSAGINGVVVDRDRPGIVSIAGVAASDGEVQVYDFNSESWDGSKYPDFLGQDISFSAMAAEVVSDRYIVVAGGDDGGSVVSSIVYLDMEADSPSWNVLDDNLPTGLGLMASVSHNGLVYIFGGNDGSARTQSTYSIDITESAGNQVTQLSDAPDPLGRGGPSAIIDGTVYVNALRYESGSPKQNAPLFKYNISNDSWSEMSVSPNKALLDGGQDPSNSSASVSIGTMGEYNGNIIYVDGGGLSDTDIAIYSPEKEQWIGKINPRYDGSAPWSGANRGRIVDGVMYIPSTLTDDQNFWAYVIEEKPFDGRGVLVDTDGTVLRDDRTETGGSAPM